MSPKAKSSLSASLNKLAGNVENKASVTVQDDSATSQRRKSKHDRPSRKSTKMIGAHFPREVSTALNVLSAEQDTTNQALLAEALNDLFSKYGKPPIA